MVYHTSVHTRYVVNAAHKIGVESGLNEDELNLVILSAWFHDIGYIKSYTDHEIDSAKIAEEFLKSHDVAEKDIETIKKAILATRIPQSPDGKIAEVLCDADMTHLAGPDYYEHVDKMREERKRVENIKLSKTQFNEISVKFFAMHQYHTEYGKTVLQKGKEKNLAMIKEQIEKNHSKKNTENKELNKEISKLQKKLEKQKGYSRGVESMFRLTARNQINLSSIADNKSNILISVNTIIISIVLSVLVSRFTEYPAIILPSLVFLTVSLVTIIFAILSTRPHISSGRFSKEDIQDKKVNLLFFGNFYNMSLDEYDWALGEMMKDDDYLYSIMIKDQYFLGKVLARKYKLLRKAYNFFMFGLIITVIAYVLAFVNI
jgi:predicted metal-dependent HD superfamily phosphohydrolase